MANQERSTVRHPVELILQDVRCFAGDQHARVRPITLLVGENGTGKTTFLGCYRALHGVLSGAEQPNFNEEPFAMGTFRDVARSRRGHIDRFKEFKLGFTLEGEGDERPIATFREKGSRPVVASLNSPSPRNLPDLVPVGPFRTQPKRTFFPAPSRGKRHWDLLHEDLVEFGHGAGLFSDIKVTCDGTRTGDALQVRARAHGGAYTNVADMGQGISQSLSILVDVMAANGSSRPPGGRTFLLQQPETHLHPRGQAQLASLFIKAFKERDNRFLIETHSDYVVDRTRISVRQGLLDPDDVSILYFEPTSRTVKIHSMYLDASGNLEGVPAGYREFFLRETNTLLGFAD